MINSFKQKLTRENLLENLPISIIIALLGFLYQWAKIVTVGVYNLETMMELLWLPIVITFYVIVFYLPDLKHIWNVICGHLSKVKHFFKMVCGHLKKFKK